MNEQTNATQPQTGQLETDDGRKVINFSVGGESYGIETTEQAAKGKKEEIEAIRR